MPADSYDIYVEMEVAWRTSIPKSLQGMKPKELVDLVRLANAENGVSQGDAGSALRQSPSGISKIMGKLTREKWVTVSRSTENHKEKLMTLTNKARLVIDNLEGKLTAAIQTTVSPRTRPKADMNRARARRPYGKQTLFTPSLEDPDTH